MTSLRDIIYNPRAGRAQDRSTGRFISSPWAYDQRASRWRDVESGLFISGKLVRAVDTMTEDDPDSVLSKMREVAEWDAARREAKERGEDGPAFPSP